MKKRLLTLFMLTALATTALVGCGTKECFDKIPANGEPVATIAIGTGFVGMMSGANFRQIVCGMHDSEQQILLHAGYTLEAVINCYNEEKGKTKTKR